MEAVNVGGRGRISCTPVLQPRVLWLISRGWSRDEAGKAYGITGAAITRQAHRDPAFRRQLDAALAHRRGRTRVAVHA